MNEHSSIPPFLDNQSPVQRKEWLLIFLHIIIRFPFTVLSIKDSCTFLLLSAKSGVTK